MASMRNNKHFNKVMFITFLIMVQVSYNSASTSHTVGDSQGWGFSVSYSDWVDGSSFVAGDTIVFNYQTGAHNVVPVDAASYKSCKTSRANLAKAKSTGSDKFQLKKGANFFICSYAGHCSAGMKVQINAN